MPEPSEPPALTKPDYDLLYSLTSSPSLPEEGTLTMNECNAIRAAVNRLHYLEHKLRSQPPG